MRVTYVGRKGVALMQLSAWTHRLLPRWSSLFRVSGFVFFITPPRVHEFAIVAIAHVIACEVIPKKASGRIVDIGLIMLQRIFVGYLALKIVRAFLSAVGDGPGFLVVVAGDRCGGPEMAVSRNFSAVVKIIEHAELQRQLVLIGRDVLAEHGERRIAVADFQIAKNLIVGTVFLDDVDDMLDWILSAAKGDGAGIVVQQVILLHQLRQLGKFLDRRRNIEASN